MGGKQTLRQSIFYLSDRDRIMRLLPSALLIALAGCISAPLPDSPIGRSWRGTGVGYLYSVFYASPGQVYDARWEAYWLSRRRTVINCPGQERLVGRRVHWYQAVEPRRRCAAAHYIFRCVGLPIDRRDGTEEALSSIRTSPPFDLNEQCRSGAAPNR